MPNVEGTKRGIKKKLSKKKKEMNWIDIGTYAEREATMISIQCGLTQKTDNS